MNYLHTFRRKPSAFTLFRRDKRLWQVVLVGIFISIALSTCRWLSPGSDLSSRHSEAKADLSHHSIATADLSRRSETKADEPPSTQISVPNGGYVFCTTVVEIEFPDRRFIGSIAHPSEGGADALLTAMEMLDHEGMPPRPWPEVVKLDTAGSDCFRTWGELWDPINFTSFGRASFYLKADEPIDEQNMRQALLRTMFGRDQFEAADKLFPDAPPPLMDNSH